GELVTLSAVSQHPDAIRPPRRMETSRRSSVSRYIVIPERDHDSLVTREREFGIAIDVGNSGGDCLSVRLDGNGKCLVGQTCEVRRCFPAPAKTRVQRAVRVIARNGEIEARIHEGLSHGNDLPVRTEAHGEGSVAGSGEIGDHSPTGAE